MPAMKLKLPKVNSIPGMKVIALMLIGPIEPAEMISTTPLPGAPTVGVCYRQYNLYGGSSDLKSDGSTRRSKQDAEFYTGSGPREEVIPYVLFVAVVFLCSSDNGVFCYGLRCSGWCPCYPYIFGE